MNEDYLTDAWIDARYFEHPGSMRQRLSAEIRFALELFYRDPPKLSIVCFERVMCLRPEFIPRSFVKVECAQSKQV